MFQAAAVAAPQKPAVAGGAHGRRGGLIAQNGGSPLPSGSSTATPPMGTPTVPAPVFTPVIPNPGPSPLMPQPPTSGGPTAPLNSEELIRAARGHSFRLNLDDVDIKVVAKLVSEMTGRNILLDNRVQGRITIISGGEVTPQEAWDLFKAALEAYNFALVKQAGIYRIVPLAEQRKTTGQVVGVNHGKSRPLPPGASVAVVRLRVANADQVANVVRPLLTQTGSVAAYPAGNAIVIQDENSNLRRLLKLARLLDVQSKVTTFKVYQPLNLSPKELAQGITTLFPEATTGVKTALFESVGAVVITAPRDLFPDIDRTVAQLDAIQPGNGDQPDFFVYYLENANADDLAKLLAKMISAPRLNAPESTANIVGPSPTPGQSASPPGPFTPMPGPGANSTSGTSGSYQGGNSPFTRSASPQPSPQQGFASNVVSADLRTNSLIFYVTPAQFATIKRLIAKLDAPGRQVFVSAVVAEEDLTKIRNFNINWQVVGSVVAAQNGGLDQASALQVIQSGGFVLGGISNQTTTVSANGTNVTFPNAFALFSFLFTDTNFNLLASPRILTQDNKEADISVSTIVPFATGVGFNINGQPIINFDYREVGLALHITPHISQSHNVRLDLDEGLQEIQSFQTEGSGATAFQVPIVSKRQVDTTINIQDGQTIVIGGLVNKTTTETIQKVPLLGDIPVLGEIFKQRQKNDQKTTLMIFLTPHIIDTPSRLGELMEEYRKAFEQRDRMKMQEEMERRHLGRKAPRPTSSDNGMFPGYEHTDAVPAVPLPSAQGAGDGVPPSGGTRPEAPYPSSRQAPAANPPAPPPSSGRSVHPQARTAPPRSASKAPPTVADRKRTTIVTPAAGSDTSTTWGTASRRPSTSAGSGLTSPAAEHTPIPAGLLW